MSLVKTARRGVTFYNPQKAHYGYTLFSPVGGKDVWLIDMEGRFINRWQMPYMPGLHGVILPSGNLLYAGQFKTAVELGLPEEFAGIGGIFLEVDWDNNLVWKVEVPYQGHDFCPMENGHIMYISWEPKGILPDEVAARVKGGRPSTELEGKIWGDRLVEIDREGKVVWEWYAWKHLDPRIDVICPYENRSQWPYLNSVWVCRDGNIILSARYISTVLKIDYQTGKVIGRYGKGQVYHQHDCRQLENGNILVFDNGSHRHEYKPSYSRSVEIDPRTDKIVWEYKANPPSDFYTAHSGGNERLPNGNTLIMETDKGRMFEVASDGEIVWEYVSPFYNYSFHRFHNIVWRAHRYDPDYPGLRGKDLNPDRCYRENKFWGPGAFNQEIKPCLF